MEVTWSDIKSFVTTRTIPLQWIELSGRYYISAQDNGLELSCSILKVSPADTDQADFETNFKSNPLLSNISQTDTDGAQLVRNKAARKGWTFCSLPFEFETARLNDTLYSKDSAGNSRSFITLKAYDGSNVEVTTPGLLNTNLATIEKTVIDFEPPYDIEIIGGDIRTLTTISSDMRLWVIAVPDIPAPTGSKEMGGGINLKYLSPQNIWSIDGRVTKFAAYNATYHTNKIRMIIKYPPGVNESLLVVVQMYRS